MTREIKNKKVLLVGLGILGGGVATTKWLLEMGADLTVTDLKDEIYLATSIEKLQEYKNKIKWILGGHKDRDFLENDIIVINPDVPVDNPFVKLAKEAGKQIENELTLFCQFCPSRKIVAITGTRGKTTTVNWTAHLLRSQYPDTLVIGNSPDKPFLQEIKKCNQDTLVVLEVPSYHLEIANKGNFASHVALITNLYRDHINRHKNMEGYALAKANIFTGQNNDDFLILNKENKWTNFFLSLKPQAQILFFSKAENAKFAERWGEHNLSNLTAASLVAKSMGVSEEKIKKATADLPQIAYRQEKVYDKDNLEIYNDSASTSPEASIAAAKRFVGCILICGGTDKDLDFSEWATAINRLVSKENLIMLSGSATEKMKKELSWDNFNEHDSLKDCLEEALSKTKSKEKAKIVFSPGAKSFEKFKNEFDRGKQFGFLIRELLN